MKYKENQIVKVKIPEFEEPILIQITEIIYHDQLYDHYDDIGETEYKGFTVGNEQTPVEFNRSQIIL
jgi:hypothetical protein